LPTREVLLDHGYELLSELVQYAFQRLVIEFDASKHPAWLVQKHHGSTGGRPAAALGEQGRQCCIVEADHEVTTHRPTEVVIP
jgi:hypothetical protein